MADRDNVTFRNEMNLYLVGDNHGKRYVLAEDASAAGYEWTKWCYEATGALVKPTTITLFVEASEVTIQLRTYPYRYPEDRLATDKPSEKPQTP